jgi:glycosyltransferase involved in cell wall biosynthesis
MPAGLSVSVIIPVYNGERFLAEAIESVRAQRYEPLEIIVVDDGSTDGTAEVVGRVREQVRFISQANRGPAAARNRGIEISSGDAIAFLDVDDLWAERTLRRHAGYLSANPSVDIVQGLIQQVRLDPSRENVADPTAPDCSEPYAFISLASAMYRRSVFETVGLLNESLRHNEDTDWFIRAWEKNVSKVVLDHVALLYRKHEGNRDHRKDLVHFGMLHVLKRHLDRWRVHGGLSQARLAELPQVCGYLGGPPKRQL